MAVEADEERTVFLRRCREAIEAGLSIKDATVFAHSDVDIGTLRYLVAHDCPLKELRRIVL